LSAISSFPDPKHKMTPLYSELLYRIREVLGSETPPDTDDFSSIAESIQVNALKYVGNASFQILSNSSLA
jgi:hypothetical protein